MGTAAPASAGTGTIVALTMAACTLRLWRLHYPETPVYDETHVGRFLGWYHERAFFFDVHGPLAKLSMYWSAVALGYDGRSSCPYESAEPFVATCDLLPQRLLPAVCGAALVPLAYCTCARMGLRPLAMLLAGWLVLIDTHLLGVSRIHLNDSIQLLLIALTHHFALGATAAPPPPPAPLPPWPQLLWQLGLTGLCLGCALQSKYAMALTTLGWLGLQNLWLLGVLAAQRRGARALFLQAAARGLVLLGLPLLLHVLLLRLHLRMLPRTGNGDAYMSPEFQALPPPPDRTPLPCPATPARATAVARRSSPRSGLRLPRTAARRPSRAASTPPSCPRRRAPPSGRGSSSTRSRSSGTTATWRCSSRAARTPSTRRGTRGRSRRSAVSKLEPPTRRTPGPIRPDLIRH